MCHPKEKMIEKKYILILIPDAANAKNIYPLCSAALF